MIFLIPAITSLKTIDRIDYICLFPDCLDVLFIQAIFFADFNNCALSFIFKKI